jgi:hypothetical protein
MRTIFKTLIPGFLGLMLMLPGCDILTDEPLVVDGITLELVFEINTGEGNTEFSLVETQNLQQILDDVDDFVEAISLSNITLRIYDLVDTPASTNLSGEISINDIDILSVNNMPLSAFENDRTIFDSSLQADGVTVQQSGIDYLLVLLESRPLPVVEARIAGSSSRDNARFTLEVKIYTQVIVNP